MTDQTIPIRKAKLARLIEAQFTRRVFSYPAISGHTIPDMCTPGYFDDLGATVARYDRIECTSEDDCLFAEFLVLNATNLGVEVVLMKQGQFEPLSASGARGAAPLVSSDYHVTNKGSHRKWCVMHADKVLKDGFATQDEASAYLAAHLRTARSAA